MVCQRENGYRSLFRGSSSGTNREPVSLCRNVVQATTHASSCLHTSMNQRNSKGHLSARITGVDLILRSLIGGREWKDFTIFETACNRR